MKLHSFLIASILSANAHSAMAADTGALETVTIVGHRDEVIPQSCEKQAAKYYNGNTDLTSDSAGDRQWFLGRIKRDMGNNDDSCLPAIFRKALRDQTQYWSAMERKFACPNPQQTEKCAAVDLSKQYLAAMGSRMNVASVARDSANCSPPADSSPLSNGVIATHFDITMPVIEKIVPTVPHFEIAPDPTANMSKADKKTYNLGADYTEGFTAIQTAPDCKTVDRYVSKLSKELSSANCNSNECKVELQAALEMAATRHNGSPDTVCRY